MRILVAPDCFTGTLSAAEAARAIKTGWLQTAPDDDVELIPLSDGGPGFCEAVVTALDAEQVPLIVSGPSGERVPAYFALKGNVAWIESAIACGLALVPEADRNPGSATSYGVGELINAAINAGATKIVVGLGGTAINDAGAGALSALGAIAIDGSLTQGGLSLAGVTGMDLSIPRARLANVELIIATDVDNPLLGLRGATATFARQKGADDSLIMRLEGALENFATVCGRRDDGKDPSVALGAGAAGGLGYGLMLVGATRQSGIESIMSMLQLDDHIAQADLVITGEGCLDDQSLHGKVVVGVASHTAALAKPCVVLAGEVRLGKRECSTNGIDAAYSMNELVGRERAIGQPSESLIALAARVAKTWSR